ncbi:MAG TPA: tetratricopeptide repeat protein [Chthoniobacterales bacterium]|jgi:tetratricopeptide (TPR) repeat protein
MAVKYEKDLNDQLRGYWLKALAAVELRNFDYAIALLQNLLQEEPEFLSGRQMLRRVEVTRAKTEKKSFFNLSNAPLAIMKAQRELRKDPRRVIELVEKVLATGPYNPQANMLLKDAAVAAGYPEIAIFAIQTLLEIDPNDCRILHELGRLYCEYEQSEKAVEIYHRISEINPLDLEAVKLGKDASASASIKKGGWTEANSYHDLINDKDLAVGLEKQSKMQLSAEALEEQINQVYEQHEADPRNIELAKRLGYLHDQKNDLEGAIAWYEYTVALTNKGDSGLVRKVADLRMRQLNHLIREGEQYLAEHSTDDPNFSTRSAELDAMRKQRAQTLIDDARHRVDQNPSDLQLRYELGDKLTDAGHFREAIPELQRARRNPNARVKAMNLLGRCYSALGMLDLAAKQLVEAEREIGSMDITKQEIVYQLGLVYEQMGDSAKYIEAMKKVYEADYSHRDVAARVEAFYNRTAGQS